MFKERIEEETPTGREASGSRERKTETETAEQHTRVAPASPFSAHILRRSKPPFIERARTQSGNSCAAPKAPNRGYSLARARESSEADGGLFRSRLSHRPQAPSSHSDVAVDHGLQLAAATLRKKGNARARAPSRQCTTGLLPSRERDSKRGVGTVRKTGNMAVTDGARRTTGCGRAGVAQV